VPTLTITTVIFFAALLSDGAAVAQSSESGGHHEDDPADGRPPSGQAAGDAPPDQIIVKFKPAVGQEERNDIRRAEKLEKVRDLGLIRAEVARVTGRPVEEAVRSLERRPGVEYAEPDYIFHATGYAAEPRFAELWGLDNVGQPIMDSTGALVAGTPDVDVNAREASAITQGDPDLVVAVIDSGVDFAHPDLADRAWVNPGESGSGKETNGVDDDGNGYVDDVNGWDFVHNDNTLHDSGNDAHATHVAGTIAASANGEGVVGVAPNVKIMSLKWLDGPGNISTAGTGYISNAILAIEYAREMGAKISNTSWGDATYSLALKDAIETSGEMLFVAGAGNNGSNNDTTPFYPASFDSPNVLSVAAIDNKGSLASFSNYGAGSVDISAPGVSILSARPGYPEKPGVALSSVGPGKALVAGFGPEEISGVTAQVSFMDKAFGAVDRGSQPVVLVDDDRSDVAGNPEVGPTLSSAIAAVTGSTPEVVRVADGNGPALSQLEGKTVVWATGWADSSGSGATTLTTSDQQTLTNFLNGGGKLILVGMDALRGIESSVFVRDVLKLKVVSDVGRLAGGSSLKFSTAFGGSPGTAFAGESYILNNVPYAWLDRHDVVAPANTTAATTQGLYPSIPGSWNYRSGTSMAAPHATGAAALAASTDPRLLGDPIALKERLMERGKPAPATAGKTVTGKIVDARAVSDVTAPAVSNVVPQNGTGDVAVDANVEATFSEAMDASTLSTSTFTLTKQGSTTPVAATVSYDSATKKATLDPNANLEVGATYMATIKGGSSGVKDTAGNALASDKTWSFTTLPDTIPPDAPTVSLASESDTGASDADGLTKDDTPTLQGKAEAYSKVSIYDGTTLLGATNAGATGGYSFVAAGLDDGLHQITAKATDAAGNSSAASAVLDVQIDTQAPDTEITASPAGAVDKDSASFEFSSEAGTTFECRLDADYEPCDSPKTYYELDDGEHAFRVKAIDGAGNVDVDPAEARWTVDTVAPSVPIITDPASDVRDNDGDFIISGTGDPNSSVELFDNGKPSGKVMADSSGGWRAEMTGVAEGSHTYTAKAVDAVGNASAATNARTVIVDTTGPTVAAVSPEPGASGVTLRVVVEATFSEAMSGDSIDVSTFKLLKRKADGTLDPVAATVTYDASANKATLTPGNDLGRRATYIVKVTAGVKDLAANQMGTAETWKFKTRA